MARGARCPVTDRLTDTHDNYHNPRCICLPRVNEQSKLPCFAHLFSLHQVRKVEELRFGWKSIVKLQWSSYTITPIPRLLTRIMMSACILHCLVIHSFIVSVKTMKIETAALVTAVNAITWWQSAMSTWYFIPMNFIYTQTMHTTPTIGRKRGSTLFIRRRKIDEVYGARGRG